MQDYLEDLLDIVSVELDLEQDEYLDECADL